jgi:hypothetical protein
MMQPCELVDRLRTEAKVICEVICLSKVAGVAELVNRLREVINTAQTAKLQGLVVRPSRRHPPSSLWDPRGRWWSACLLQRSTVVGCGWETCAALA